MSKRQGHTIIHYLYTGTYKYLEPVEKSAEIDENKFIDAVKICDFAEKFGIDSLATLASKDIKKFGDGLKFSTIYKILSVHIPMFQHEYGELTYYLNVRANLEKEEITEGEINELQRVTSPDNLADTMAQNMLKMKLTVQKYKELYGPLPEDEDYEEE